MSELITNVNLLYQGPGIQIVHAQDVEPFKKECFEQRKYRKQQGRQGLGVLRCSIPYVEIEKAKAEGINLYKKDQRERWLKDHPEYIVYQDTGKSGRIIIK